MTNALRPYYNAETFESPVKSHQGLTVVHGGNTENSSFIATSPARKVSRGDHNANFVYLDLDVGGDNIQAIGATILRLYTRVLVSQPFEVARVLLQVGNWDSTTATANGSSGRKGASSTTPTDSKTRNGLNRSQYGGSIYDEIGDGELDDDYSDGESSDEDVNFFSSIDEDGKRPTSTRKIHRLKRNPGSPRSDREYVHAITPMTLHLMDVLSALQQADGLKGMWRGLHTTFVLEAAASVVESWVSGFISSVAAIPDPHFVPILHSPSPMASLAAAVCAAVSTTLLLMPFDVIKVRFFTTTFATKPRSFRACCSRLTSFRSPSLVLIPAALSTGLSSLIQLATPYFLYTRMGIDRFSAPSLFNIGLLISSLFTMTVKLPLETMMHRAEVKHLQDTGIKPSNLIIRPKQYSGVAHTIWDVMVGRERIDSLYKGWRLSATAAIAEWGVYAIQQADKTPEHF